jgi:hypothetical protein
MRLPTAVTLGSGLVWPHFGNYLSKNSSFLNREKHSIRRQRHPGRGNLLRLEKQRLLTEGATYTVTSLSGEDK